MIGRPYQAPATSDTTTTAQRATVKRLRREHEWTEVRPLASGVVEVAVLDFRGIIDRIVTVAADGSQIG